MAEDQQPTLPQPPQEKPGFYLYFRRGSDQTYRYWNGTSWEGPDVVRKPTKAGWYCVGTDVAGNPDEYQYWTGTRWESEILSTAEFEAPAIRAMAPAAEEKQPWLGLLRVLLNIRYLGAFFFFVLLAVLIFALMRGGGDDTASQEPQLTAESGQVAGAATAEGEGTAAAGEAETGSGQETGSDQETAGSCPAGRTFTGTPRVLVAGLPGSGEGIGSAEFVVTPQTPAPWETGPAECVVEAKIAFAEQSQNDEWITPSNRDGYSCTVAEFDAGNQFYWGSEDNPEVGPLTWTPKSDGGGTVAGWMVAHHGNLDVCPESDGLSAAIGPYLGNPIGGEFTGTISDGVLSGFMEFTGTDDIPALRIVTLQVTASCTSQCA